VPTPDGVVGRKLEEVREALAEADRLQEAAQTALQAARTAYRALRGTLA